MAITLFKTISCAGLATDNSFLDYLVCYGLIRLSYAIPVLNLGGWDCSKSYHVMILNLLTMSAFVLEHIIAINRYIM